MKKLFFSLFLVSIASLAILYFTPYRTSLPFFRNKNYTYENYKKEIDTIRAEQMEMAEQVLHGGSASKKRLLEEAKKKFLLNIETRLFPFWEGTDWDFNGTTEVPGKGSIACGYFVTTILRD